MSQRLGLENRWNWPDRSSDYGSTAFSLGKSAHALFVKHTPTCTKMPDRVTRADAISLLAPAMDNAIPDCAAVPKAQAGVTAVNASCGSSAGEEVLANLSTKGQFEGAELDMFETDALGKRAHLRVCERFPESSICRGQNRHCENYGCYVRELAACGADGEGGAKGAVHCVQQLQIMGECASPMQLSRRHGDR